MYIDLNLVNPCKLITLELKDGSQENFLMLKPPQIIKGQRLPAELLIVQSNIFVCLQKIFAVGSVRPGGDVIEPNKFITNMNAVFSLNNELLLYGYPINSVMTEDFLFLMPN